MSTYRKAALGAIALTVACWGLATGLAIEKVVADGVSSFTLLFAMPVLTLAIGWLFHQCVSDYRDLRPIRGTVCLFLALSSLMVTLPNSIGSSGGAKDAAVAEAQASNRGLALAEGALTKAQADLEDAKLGVLRECEGAPAVTPEGTWPKCNWWRRQVAAHTLSVADLSKQLVTAPAEKAALSGESRIAWAAQKAGLGITEQDVQMAQPMGLPLVLEMLCAFSLFMALEFYRLSMTDNTTATSAKPLETPAIAATELAHVSDTELARLKRWYFERDEEPVSEPQPPKPRKRNVTRKDRVIQKIRAHTLKHGAPPAFSVVRSRHRLSNGSAHRYLAEARRTLN